MYDPFPIPCPTFLHDAIQPIAERYSLPTLPSHIHEVLIALGLYHSINLIFSPWASRKFFPKTYTNFNKRTRLNWDVHVVSLVQSCLINVLALWVSFVDRERAEWDWRRRVWGYDGAGGLIQAFACGYFLWDIWISLRYVGIFGIGLLAHAVSALCVFIFGFVSLTIATYHFTVVMLPSATANIHVTITETIRQLLRSHVYPIRALVPISEHPLVLR
jgi:hypothetical protein